MLQLLPVKVLERSLATDSRRQNDGNLTVRRRYKHNSSPRSASASFLFHFPMHFPIYFPVLLLRLFNHIPMTASFSAPLALLATIVAPLVVSFNDNCGLDHGVNLGLQRREISIS